MNVSVYLSELFQFLIVLLFYGPSYISTIYIFLATDAYCLLEIYKFLSNCFQSTDYLQLFRGKKPKKLDSTIARQIDENFSNQSQTSNDIIRVCI